jgi:hypothetical protein
LITYKDIANRITLVKVKLIENELGCEPIEFDVEFAGIAQENMDVTINWKQ